jgi:hypothetical protein
VPRDGGGGGETVVEEGFYGGCFWDGGVFGNEADESTWRKSVESRGYMLKEGVSDLVVQQRCVRFHRLGE